ncbi:MAG: hypothetical protein OJI74_06090 [Rhodanobacter thiooxydans]|nr:hypothetical protein [Rhodanobacter thiooxydans]MCW0201422.1 hypothetical protein [Rhodanobacter thiooxydans]
MGSLGQFLERLPLDGDIPLRKSAGEKRSEAAKNTGKTRNRARACTSSGRWDRPRDLQPWSGQMIWTAK